MKRATFLLTVCCVFATICPAAEKPRIVVMTDIGGDPDDRQSMVRFVLYTCDFDVEGFCTGFGHGHYKETRPDLIHDAVDAYGEVVANLRKHRPDYPSHAELRALIKDGHNGDPHTVGPGMDSEASEWIVKVLDKEDPRPVWFSIWGGPRELAQAIWKVQRTRSAEELAAFKKKIRVHSIADQDRTAQWIKKNHADVFWIFSRVLFRGIWKEGDQSIVSPAWLKENVLQGHGALGPLYPPKAAGKDGVKEGDTPSFLYLLPNGLSDPAHPTWGNWGGRFKRRGRGNEYVPALDWMRGGPDMLYTIHRWREDYQNEFEARMDWCVKPYDQANHAPAAVCNGDTTVNVLRAGADPGAEAQLCAEGSSDPDGDRLSYKWWTYVEPGSYWAEARIDDFEKADAVLHVPTDAAGRSIHVILEVLDDGEPPLRAYRRVIIDVSGKAVRPPRGAEAFGRVVEPVTELSGPPASMGRWEFYRGININGPAITIDGHRWQGDNAKDFVCKNTPVNSPQVVLWPPTDENRAKMIHSFRWDRKAEIEVKDVPQGRYAVYAYVWEDNNSERFSIRLNGRQVQHNYESGNEGQWRRLGPWVTKVTDRRIRITTHGGAANFSGLEIWRSK
mgnify:CR=1 FL=1